ncbi:MAG TPA: nucleotidyl transferase AbiEii/AbiGii toxin family protein [Vicinamibacteria bacterium]|nr:nucleotidyl transferase AbiEii/AbiGii toxin family protein [Vicinamibacteria bacterium]
MEPKRPEHLSEFARISLEALAEAGLGQLLSLGGAIGLLHYLDYRETHDVDAWWAVAAGHEERERVLAVVEDALAPYGEIRRRSWGDVVSIDLREGGKTVFNFQIAARSAQLEPTRVAPWVDVSLDSLTDVLASKMVALVERGAPRDFRDVFAVCRASLATAEECWGLWRRRQELAGSDTGAHRARLAIETHLERISRHRPLEAIEDATQREEVAILRQWFVKEFLDALRD